jgi:hypothetical protein
MPKDFRKGRFRGLGKRYGKGKLENLGVGVGDKAINLSCHTIRL